MEDIVASARSACYILSTVLILDPKLEPGRMPQSLLITTNAHAAAAPSPQRYQTALNTGDPSETDTHHWIERSIGSPATIHDPQEVR
jgi:hypothetical protein